MRHRWQLRASLLAAVVSLVSYGLASAESKTKKLFDSYDLDSTRFVFTEAGDTGKEAGWIPIGDDTHKTIIISITRLDVTGGIDIRIQGRSSVPGGRWTKFVLHELNKTEPVARQHITLPTGKFDQLRVGLRIGGSDDASDTGDAAENVTVTYHTFTLR
ncbi:MAG: hypothetical protein E2P02_24125 [Acidobacteria bacterium]|nr:MAG: hypothetical protein E2P02_24125 [Acidobacteriota bacterium]